MSTTTSETASFMKPQVSACTNRPLEASSEFTVSLRSLPYLADHGFQDMIVLPGSFYIDTALRMEHELGHCVPSVVRNVTFHNPIILSAEDTVINVETSDLGDGRVEYAFYEGGAANDDSRPPIRQPAARLEIERPDAGGVAQTSKSAVSRVSKPASDSICGHPADLEIGDTAGLKTCATQSGSDPAKCAAPSNARSETESGARTDTFSIETFQAQAQAVTGSEQFYKRLREIGNQYGPRFQNVSAIWRTGDQALGKLSVPRQIEPHHLQPTLLDAITQLLASFIMEKGKTFVLRAIEKIEITNVNFPDTLWGHATLLAQDERGENGLLGNVRVFDQAGKTYLELSGVAFTLLDRVDPTDERPPANLVIAANFTAEPLEDSLNFWGDHFGVPIRAEFAPYNQVFQQLLDAGSAFHKNTEGVNVILLGLEEWANNSRMDNSVLHMQHEVVRSFRHDSLDRTHADQCFGNRSRYILPNGLEIVHLNKYETDYVYQEIFEDQCYLRHGIRLRDGDTVVDIGANIGLFSMFVMCCCKDPKIYAFEPAPVVFDLLQANCRAHGLHARAVNAGVSDKARTATFTFYEKSSVFSSFHADEVEDREAIQTIVRNMLNDEAAEGESMDEYVNELTADRLRRQACECQLTCVSDIIRENQIETVNLLKIDAEKSELDILSGIADCDWPRISQIVMEIHDRTGQAVKRIEALLNEKGFHCAVEHEKLLEDSGLFNLYAIRDETDQSPANASVAQVSEPAVSPISQSANRATSGDLRVGKPATQQTWKSAPQPGGDADETPREYTLNRNIQDFCTSLRSFCKDTTTPLVLCICPRSPAAEADAGLAKALNEAGQTLLSEAGTTPNMHTISSAMMLQRYPVKDYYDPHGHDLGHIPYTPECYAAIGTALFRTVFNLKRRPFKVIALDCDNTLWRGVCGEDGPRGIEISPPFRALQEFMIGQMNAGMLLCLCSKNNEKDVLEVFAQRTDLPLKREHLVAWRINWNSKSANLKSLAQELNLGLDSFIFVDDNPVECAEVRINCPGILTLQLPGNAESFASFLSHVWAFDHSGSTEEDQKRTRMYQESVKRQQFREQSLSLRDYVKGLQLRVEITEATDDQIGRVSQLTFRTNQFNFTSIRRSEKEVRDFLDRDGAHCLVVRVADRFGDYGLVGVVMYEALADRFKVDTFLLSCRVLGRGAEHAVVSHLGQRAVGEGKQVVELTCLPTDKNQPAREFITRIGEQHRHNGGTCWILPAEHLASLEYNPDKAASNGHEDKLTVKPEKPIPNQAWGFDVADLSERLQQIAEELWDASRLGKAIEEHRLRKEASHEPLTPTLSPSDGERENVLQTALLNIWRKVLGRPRIGMNDNFFEAGGTSLRAVQVIATIKRELKKTLSIVSLFECPTVALLAARLDERTTTKGENEDDRKAALRGQQRRYKTVKRKAALQP